MGVEGGASRVLRRVWYRWEGQKSLLGMEGWEEVVWGGCGGGGGGGGGLFGRVVYTWWGGRGEGEKKVLVDSSFCRRGRT